MKPLGITMHEDSPHLRVTHPSLAADAVWDAVREAIAESWTPERFLREVREAWEHEKKQELKSDMEALR